MGSFWRSAGRFSAKSGDSREEQARGGGRGRAGDGVAGGGGEGELREGCKELEQPRRTRKPLRKKKTKRRHQQQKTKTAKTSSA